MNTASQTNERGNRRALFIGGVGYGIVCGLTFPLMISNTFLREMSLSHGAGDSFGALFFLAYAAAMLVLALWHLISHRPLPSSSLAVALGAVFLGNVLMLLHNLSVIEGGWPYAIVTGLSIGFGLATAELGWMEKLVSAGKDDTVLLPRMVSLACLVGGVAAAFIFFAIGPVELTFALLIILLSGMLLMRMPKAIAPIQNIAPSRSDNITLVKAISYLAVFSFVFGAASQMVETSSHSGIITIEFQATISIIGAALIFLAASLSRKHIVPISDPYGLLFPIVAGALVALPFIATPWVHGIASILIFAAFYLSGMNVRIIVSQLSRGDHLLLWVYLGCALGIGSLLVIVGVAFGATVLSHGSPETALALVSLISLFILALNPILAHRIEKRASLVASPNDSATPDTSSTQAPEDSVESFARKHSLTARESEVLLLLCQGRTRTYIADELGLSPNTIKGYIRSIYQKSGSVDKQDLLDRIELFRNRQ